MVVRPGHAIRGVVLAFVVFLLLAGPAGARTIGVFTYETIYSGTYSYGSDTSCPGSPECLAGSGTQYGEGYTWLADKLDTFPSKSNGTYTELIRYMLSATGSQVEHVYNGSDLYYSIRCTISSKPKIAWTEKLAGKYPAVAKAIPDPLLTVAWQVPYLTNDPVQGFSSGPGLNESCSPTRPESSGSPVVVYSSDYANEAADHIGGVCGNEWLEPTDAFYTLWGSQAKVRLSALPYHRSFSFRNAISEPASGEISSCSENVHYASRLQFVYLTAARKGTTVPVTVSSGSATTGLTTGAVNPNKVGSLLLSDGVMEMTGTSSPVDSGDPATILFPGMPGSGGVTLDVTGQVVGPVADAAAAKVLFAGHAKAKAGRPFTIALSPSAAGRQLLSGTHGAVKLTAKARFRPSRRGKTITAKLTFTVPAN